MAVVNLIDASGVFPFLGSFKLRNAFAVTCLVSFRVGDSLLQPLVNVVDQSVIQRAQVDQLHRSEHPGRLSLFDHCLVGSTGERGPVNEHRPDVVVLEHDAGVPAPNASSRATAGMSMIRWSTFRPSWIPVLLRTAEQAPRANVCWTVNVAGVLSPLRFVSAFSPSHALTDGSELFAVQRRQLPGSFPC